MKSFPEKVKDARCELGLSQTQLGEAAGVSLRTILSYEKGVKKPRRKTLVQLAKALKVSVKYLEDDNCENPTEDIEKDGYIEAAWAKYGARGAMDVEELLSEDVDEETLIIPVVLKTFEGWKDKEAYLKELGFDSHE